MVTKYQDSFNEQTGLFRCSPCATNVVSPRRENGEMPWQQTKVPANPVVLPPLGSSATAQVQAQAAPNQAGFEMSELDRLICAEAAQDSAAQPGKASPVLGLTVAVLCAACLYCKVSGPVAPVAVSQESIADYQKRMREAQAQSKGVEQRPAIRIPDLKRGTGEGVKQ